MSKFQCGECKVILNEDKMPRVMHPINHYITIKMCPYCKNIYDLIRLCDEDGCNEYACCDTPAIKYGYKMTCENHFQREILI